MACDVLFDVLTPKQALFFWAVGLELKSRGFETSYVTRSYEQLDWIERDLGLEVLRAGRFGDESLEGKLLASTERQAQLIEIVREIRPKLTVSSGSIELCRVSYGLSMKHYLASDTPHSPVNRACVPLSDLVATPRFIPIREWRRWATPSTRFLRYRGLDPIAWMRRLNAHSTSASHGRYVLVRLPERKASYVSERGLDSTSRIVKILSTRYDGDVLVVTRYRDDASMLARDGGDRVKMLVEPTLLLPLIANADAVFSGGGTTAQEAALLGVPAFSFYPGELPAVHRFLLRRGFLRLIEAEERSVIGALELARDASFRKSLEEKARRFRDGMEDPAVAVAVAITEGLR
ncbi:MAG: DUF354 domain-containing protein [Nitrososphaerota archaeon]|nr:DUF354 domain-containing protein [Nitrososphaerota archaeon]